MLPLHPRPTLHASAPADPLPPRLRPRRARAPLQPVRARDRAAGLEPGAARMDLPELRHLPDAEPDVLGGLFLQGRDRGGGAAGEERVCEPGEWVEGGRDGHWGEWGV